MKDAKNQTQKRPVSPSAVTRIVIWSVTLCILSGLLAWGLSREGGGIINLGGYWYDDAGFSVGNGRSSERISDISIDWLAGDVTVLPAEGDEIVITEDYDGEDALRLRWRVKNGELTVKYSKPKRFGTVKASTKNLTVAIPAAMLEAMGEVEIDAVDGNVFYTGNADELDLDTVDVDLTVTGDIGELNMDAVDAQVTFKGAVRHADIDGVDTDVTMHLDMAKELDLDQVRGSVQLFLSEEITGFSAEIEAISGDIDVDGYDGVSYGEAKSARWGDGSLRIQADGVSCQLKIEKLTKD